MKLPLVALLVAISATSMACDLNQNDRPDAETNRVEPLPTGEVDRVNTNLQAAKQDNDLEEKEENKREATELVREASATLEKMKKDEGVKKLLSESKGLFIVPDYGRAALGVGAGGGEGILIARRDAQSWSDPAFYDVGGISVGAQLGGEGGEIAMILMSDEALKSFKNENSFSLSAGAGLTIVDYSALAQASLGKEVGNVVFWSDTKGAFAGVSLSATDISWNKEENLAYYGKTIKPEDALTRQGSAPKGELQENLGDI